MLPKKVIPFIWYFLRRYKSNYFLYLLTDSFNSMLKLFGGAYVLGLLLDYLLVDNFSINKVIVYVLLIGCIEVFYFFSTSILDILCFKTLKKISLDVKKQLFNSLLKQSNNFFNNNFSGGLSTKVNTISEKSEEFITDFSEFAIDMNILFIFIFINYRLQLEFLAVLAVWLVLFSFGYFFIKKKSFQFSEKIANSSSILTGKMVDSFTNISNIKLFAKDSVEKSNFNASTIKLLSLKFKNSLFSAIDNMFLFVMLASFIALSLYVIVLNYRDGLLTIGEVAGRIAVVISLNWWLVAALESLSRCITYSGQIQDGLDTLIIPHSIENYSKESHNLTDGNIELKDVFFKYQENLPLVFENFNLSIKSSEKVGLVGYSGSGKSTLITLLLRFYDVNSGIISIDGVDIKTDISQESLRRNISFIPQDPILFHRTIRENLVYGNAKASEEELIEACKKACCYDFILNLENGFETLVGERGVKLSGGQRQRIAIARAILKNSKILILDEATSSLDSITENEIQIALTNLMENKTVIVVAHRLSTLNNMDRIIVLDKGKIKEDGTKNELLSLENGLFKKMWDMQKGGKLDLE